MEWNLDGQVPGYMLRELSGLLRSVISAAKGATLRAGTTPLELGDS
jgi:hypothetical protein